MSIQSLVNAANVAVPLVIPPGTYNENVTIPANKSGLKLIGGPGVRLVGTEAGWNGIHVDANHVTIDGFDISGARGDGIEANGQHHITVKNCKITGSGESGIQFNQSEFITIEGNILIGNGLTGWFSGISVYQCRKIGGAGTLDGVYKTIIRNNVCDNNVTSASGFSHTDGNGIIIDDMNGTQGGSAWGGKTLVENNLCRGNGGKGIQVTWSDDVTVKNNTTKDNGADTLFTETWRGELSVSASKRATVLGNIAVAKDYIASRRSYAYLSTSKQSEGANSGATWAGNVGWHPRGTPSVLLDGGNTIPAGGIQWVDPKLDANGVPTIATTAGYRPAGVTPDPDPNPEPDPDMEALIARIVALETAINGLRTATAGLLVSIAEAKVTVDALATRVTGLEAPPMDPAFAARFDAAMAEITRLDGRLDAISGAAAG